MCKMIWVSEVPDFLVLLLCVLIISERGECFGCTLRERSYRIWCLLGNSRAIGPLLMYSREDIESDLLASTHYLSGTR